MNDIEIVRSWPPEQWMLDDHPYVVDNARRIVIGSQKTGPNTYYNDMRPLSQVGQDFIHLDWDMAVGRDELRAFADKCRQKPDKLRSAACRTYPTRRYQLGDDPDKRTRWHAWHSLNPEIEVNYGDPVCKWFSFAFIYVPFAIWTAFVTDFNKVHGTRPRWCSGRSLASWYHKNVSEEIDLDWDTHVVHANYSIRDALNLDY